MIVGVRLSSSDAPVFPVFALGVSQPEILALFSGTEQKQIRETLQQLSGLTRHIGKNFTMNILLGIPGEDSCWNPNTHDVYIDPLCLLKDPIEVLRFIVCHEGGHCRISRPDLISKDYYHRPGFPVFYNYLEDPRVNNFLCQGDRGFREGQSLAYNRMLEQSDKIEKQATEAGLHAVPRYLLACTELLRFWFLNREGKFEGFSPGLPDTVVDALEAALPGAQKYWRVYQSKHGANDRSLVEKSTRYAHDIMIADVWPAIEPLIELDIADEIAAEGSGEGAREAVLEKIATFDQMFENQAEEAKPQAAEGVAGIAGIAAPDASEVPQGEGASASDQIDHDGAADKCVYRLPPFPHRFGVEFDVFDESSFDPSSESPWNSYLFPPRLGGLDRYLEVLKEINPLINPLVQELASVFFARAKTGIKRGLTDGVDINLDDRLQEIAQGIHICESQAWMNYTLPTVRDYAVTLLVDLSGSMRGEKILETFKACILLSEVLFRLGIEFEVLGFNGGMFDLKAYAEPFGDTVRERLGSIEHEVFSEAAAFNNDGYALSYASDRLQKCRPTEKRLLVLSDGMPVPSPGYGGVKWELSGMVKKIIETTNQLIIGLGLGPGTGHVKHYYPHSLADIDVKKLVAELADLLRAVLVSVPVYRKGAHQI